MEISPNFTIGSIDQAIVKGKESNSDMDMDDFIKIMAASLKMPSPDGESGGNSSTDFMGQMIQFSTMEQLNTLTETLSTTMLMTQQQQALAMIGKEATVVQDGTMVKGTVEKVRFFNGYATIQLNGKDYYMNNVQEVGLGQS